MADAIVQKLGATGPTIYASKSLQNGDELTVDTSSTTTTTIDASGYLYTTSLYDLVKLNVYRPSTGELFTYDVFVRPFGTDVKPFYKFNWMILSAAAAEFTPLQLFSNGEQGAWYDPSDLTTLYQDSAGTTPVTADGDPVGLMLDKSGNGNHASQASDSARPVYPGLVHDGVDDRLTLSKPSIASGTLYMTFSRGSERTGILLGSVSAGAFVAVYDTSATADAAGPAVAGDVSVDGTAATFRADLLALLPENQWKVVKVTGVDLTDTSWDTAALQLLGYRSTQFLGDGSLGGVILVEGAVDTETDQRVRDYLYGKVGVTA